jgi:hypothetical protein
MKIQGKQFLICYTGDELWITLSVEGYTKPSAKLEINVDVKYVGEDERTKG